MVPWNQLQEGSPACEVSGWVGIIATKTERITQIHFQGRRSRRRRVRRWIFDGSENVTLKMNSRFLNFVKFIPLRRKCQMYANFAGVDSLRTIFKNGKKNSSSLICVFLRHFHVAIVHSPGKEITYRKT